MKTVTALTRLKTRLQINNNTEDKLLKLLLEEAREDILSYTRRTEDQWIPAFDAVQVKMAAEAYGRLGAEGMQSRTEGGVSTTFAENGAIKALDRYRLIKGL